MRPKPGGIVQDGGPQQAGRLIAMLALEQVGQRLRPQERLVADQHQCGALHSQPAASRQILTA